MFSAVDKQLFGVLSTPSWTFWHYSLAWVNDTHVHSLQSDLFSSFFLPKIWVSCRSHVACYTASICKVFWEFCSTTVLGVCLWSPKEMGHPTWENAKWGGVGLRWGLWLGLGIHFEWSIIGMTPWNSLAALVQISCSQEIQLDCLSKVFSGGMLICPNMCALHCFSQKHTYSLHSNNQIKQGH